MKKLLFLGACLVALASQPVLAQTGGADVVIVRAYQINGKCVIATSRGTGKTEVTSVDVPINNFKNQASTAEAYHQIIAALVQQGYSLKGMSGGDDQTTWVFSK
jgi:hypothetical protein